MGSGNNRNPAGGFIKLEWKEEPKTIEGVKVLYNDTNKRSNDLPAYSNTSSMYFKRDASGEITQLRVYDKKHQAMLDIDINPRDSHRNKDGTIIPAGVTHVHEWKMNPDGTISRGQKARLLTAAEIKKYGKKLEAANKHVKYKHKEDKAA